MTEGSEDQLVRQAVASRGRRGELDRNEMGLRITLRDAAGKADFRHVERDFRAEDGQRHDLHDGAGDRHFMDEALGIDTRKDDAALDPRGDAAELAPFLFYGALRSDSLFDFRGFGHSECFRAYISNG